AYGAPQPVPPTVMDKGMRSTLTGLYVQDQIALGNWHTTIGVRQDWSTIDSTDRLWHSGFTQKDQATT
ncbi:TonB-dependent receptor domain-containing protein, partial [Pseudomonas aeruginosa]